MFETYSYPPSIHLLWRTSLVRRQAIRELGPRAVEGRGLGECFARESAALPALAELHRRRQRTDADSRSGAP